MTGYYNEARILNPQTFETIKVLPNMPGSVTSFIAGRTYPMEGTAVLLPQHAPYTDPLEILICGGSDFGVALDNCVSIVPEAPNPTWTLERMVRASVIAYNPPPHLVFLAALETCHAMYCRFVLFDRLFMAPANIFAALPDGTYLIVNGAQQGVAGFGLATNPNLQALLYDPSQPVHQRISILNTTIVARLYHSEATVSISMLISVPILTLLLAPSRWTSPHLGK